MPCGLADELMARFAPKTVVVTPVAKKSSLVGKVRAFLATPAFGIAAAAVVVLGIAAPMISGTAPQESFRGTDALAFAGGEVTIVFVGTNRAVQSAVEDSGNFEPSAFRSAVDFTAVQDMSGAKVVIDFNGGNIIAINAEGTQVHSVRIPAETDKAAVAVADAVSRL